MPRNKRINVPGAVHHVIVRGLDRQDIFLDDHDRIDFLGRLEKALSQTGCCCQCYAWVLLDNHFHLLIRTGGRALSDLMRKVLSGYAIPLTAGINGMATFFRIATNQSCARRRSIFWNWCAIRPFARPAPLVWISASISHPRSTM